MPIETKKTRAWPHRSPLDAGRIGRPPVEPQIKRFEKAARKRLRKLVKSSPRFGDLLFSFPGAAYAIAIGGPSSEARAAGVAAVKSGAPLQAVADALGLPVWYRRLPPEAFAGPVEAPLVGPNFARFVVNVTPEEPSAVAPWLQALVAASRAAGEKVAAWLAKQAIWSAEPELARQATLPVAAYAWHSVHREARARSFMDRFWTKHMTFRNAATEARIWLERATSRACAEDEAATRSWRTAQRAGGFVIQPLTTAAELQAEADRMNNCIATYTHFMERGGCLLFAVRRGSKSVASLELRPDPNRVGAARIIQLEGPGNTQAAERVRASVEKWLSRQGPFPLAPGGGIASRPVNAERWKALWAEFVDDVGPAAAGPFAADPTPSALRAVAGPLNALEGV